MLFAPALRAAFCRACWGCHFCAILPRGFSRFRQRRIARGAANTFRARCIRLLAHRNMQLLLELLSQQLPTAITFAVATASDTAAVGGSRGISLNKVFCTTAVSNRFLSYAPQQQQPSFPNVWPTPPTPIITETTGPPYYKLAFPKFYGKEDPLT